jgi:type II secretory pathway pseudopilin PulG
MKVASISGGFTIVETLIVLAVVGVLTISTITMISGRVAINRQNDALFQLESGLRSSFNDVANGKYQNNNYTCAQGSTLTLDSGGNGGFGTGGGSASITCDYAGKQFTFGPESYAVDSLITNEATPLFSDTTTTAPAAATVKVDYPNSMNLVKTVPSSPQYVYMINTVYPNAAMISGAFTSGQQNIVLANTLYPKITESSPALLTNGLRLCFTDGSYSKASILIGSDGTLTSSTNDSSC